VYVIGAGLPRTGTSSFMAALNMLGCGPCYHNVTLWEKPGHVALWQAIADGQVIAWDELFAGYNSAVDWPPSIYYDQLMQAYPEAKIVLTVRDAERWYESLSNTILWAMQQPTPPAMAAYTRLMAGYWDRIFEGGIYDRSRALAMFERLNQQVRERVPRDRLLVYEVKEGWEPLCRFLGRPVPADTPFPKINDTQAFRQRLLDMQR
jgi:sulfotransferase family protein